MTSSYCGIPRANEMEYALQSVKTHSSIFCTGSIIAGEWYSSIAGERGWPFLVNTTYLLVEKKVARGRRFKKESWQLERELNLSQWVKVKASIHCFSPANIPIDLTI